MISAIGSPEVDCRRKIHFLLFMAHYNPTILKFILLVVLAVNASCETTSNVIAKRSLVLEDTYPWPTINNARLSNGSPWSQGWPSLKSGHSLGFGPTPTQVINAISVAKQASANVLIAHQHLQAAKENVLNQQRIATEKKTQAVILKQKSQAAAALQRSEAIQRTLAASKAAVAHAAAHATAVEVQKAETEAAKLGHLTRNAHPNASLQFSLANNQFPVTNLDPIGFGAWLAGNIAEKPVMDWY